jgi:hypothetical protein
VIGKLSLRKKCALLVGNARNEEDTMTAPGTYVEGEGGEGDDPRIEESSDAC